MPSWMEARRLRCHQAIADRLLTAQQAPFASRTLACKMLPVLDRATQEALQVIFCHKGRQALVLGGNLTKSLMLVVQGEPLTHDCTDSHP